MIYSTRQFDKSTNRFNGFSRVLGLTALGLWFGAAHPVLGQDWTLTSAPQEGWNSIASSADGAKLAAAGGYFNHGQTIGVNYVSANAGNTWVLTGAPTNDWSSVASSADGTKLVAAANGSGIFTSSDSGATWASTTAPSTNWVSAAASADGATIVAVSAAVGLIYTSTNAGVIWSAAIVPTDFGSPFTIWSKRWVAAAASADGSKLVALANYEAQGFSAPDSYLSVLYTSTNSGATWSSFARAGEMWSSVALSADGTKWLGAVGLSLSGGFGPIYTSTDSDLTWNPTTAPMKDWRAVASSADGVKLVAAARYPYNASGVIYVSLNSGASWVPASVRLTAPPNLSWSSVTSSADGCKLVAVTLGGGIYTSQSKPTPLLSLAPSGGISLISWTIPSMDCVLQQNSDLTTTNWTDVATPPVFNLTNLLGQVLVSPAKGNVFYRLKH